MRHLGSELHASSSGSRLRNNANTHTVERAVALVCLLILAIGVLLVMRPFLSALLWGTILTISTWPLHVRLTRALGGRTGASAAFLTLAACAVFLIPLALLGQNLAENVGQLAVKLEEWRSNDIPAPPSWVAPLPLFGSRLHLTLPRQTGPDVKFEHHLEEGHDEEDAEAVHGGVQSCGGCPAG
jgi:predicted PurR-regulated permease PerM